MELTIVVALPRTNHHNRVILAGVPQVRIFGPGIALPPTNHHRHVILSGARLGPRERESFAGKAERLFFPVPQFAAIFLSENLHAITPIYALLRMSRQKARIYLDSGRFFSGEILGTLPLQKRVLLYAKSAGNAENALIKAHSSRI